MPRIYVVSVKESQKKQLVRAESKAGALRHVAEKTMGAEVASQDDLVEMIGSGLKVEDAGKEEPESAPEAEESTLSGKKEKKDWAD